MTQSTNTRNGKAIKNIKAMRLLVFGFRAKAISFTIPIMLDIEIIMQEKMSDSTLKPVSILSPTLVFGENSVTGGAAANLIVACQNAVPHGSVSM